VWLAYQLFKSVEVVAAITAAVTTKQYVGNRCGAETNHKNLKKEKIKTTSKNY
jgi:hypothetical protein